MSLFPFATDAEVEVSAQEVPASSIREYGIDFRSGRLTGKIVEGVEALCVWAYLALQAKRYHWIIYSWYYGEEYSNLIGKSYSDAYIYSEVRRYIEECLLENEHITGIDDLEVSQVNDKLYIRFKLVTAFGTGEVDLNV